MINSDFAKSFALFLAIASPVIAAGIVLEKVDRAKEDIIRNQDSDAQQWRRIVETQVLAARLDERSKCH